MEILEEELLRLVNEYRAANSQKAVSPSFPLYVAAMRQSLDLAYTGTNTAPHLPSAEALHTGSDGSKLAQRVSDTGYVGSMSENVASLSVEKPEHLLNSAKAIFDAWKSSRSHNANMLNTAWKDAGLAVVYGRANDRYYAVMVFAAAADPQPVRTIAAKTILTANLMKIRGTQLTNRARIANFLDRVSRLAQPRGWKAASPDLATIDGSTYDFTSCLDLFVTRDSSLPSGTENVCVTKDAQKSGTANSDTVFVGTAKSVTVPWIAAISFGLDRYLSQDGDGKYLYKVGGDMFKDASRFRNLRILKANVWDVRFEPQYDAQGAYIQSGKLTVLSVFALPKAGPETSLDRTRQIALNAQLVAKLSAALKEARNPQYYGELATDDAINDYVYASLMHQLNSKAPKPSQPPKRKLLFHVDGRGSSRLNDILDNEKAHGLGIFDYLLNPHKPSTDRSLGGIRATIALISQAQLPSVSFDNWRYRNGLDDWRWRIQFSCIEGNGCKNSL